MRIYFVWGVGVLVVCVVDALLQLFFSLVVVMSVKPVKRKHEPEHSSKLLGAQLEQAVGNVRDLAKRRKRYEEDDVVRVLNGNVTLMDVEPKVSLPPTAEPIDAEEVPNAFVIDKLPNQVYDAHAWTAKLNKPLEKYAWAPKFPFIALAIGGIYTGKTNLATHMACFYSHTCHLQNLTVVSPTATTDPSWATVRFNAHPDTEVQLHMGVPEKEISDDYLKIAQQISPVVEATAQRRFHSASLSEIDRTLLPPADLHHPFTDDYGKSHPHVPNTPQFLFGKPYTTSRVAELRNNRALTGSFRTFPEHSLQSCLKDPVGKSMPQGSSAAARYYAQAMDPVTQAVNLQDVESSTRGHHLKLRLKEKPFENRLVFLDDPYSYLRHPKYKKFWENYGTSLRHAHNSLWVCAQKLTMIPPVLRASATNILLWRTKAGKEETWLMEEFGGDIEHFLELFHYATTPDEINQRPFMYIDKSTAPATVMRCFTHKLRWTGATVASQEVCVLFVLKMSHEHAVLLLESAIRTAFTGYISKCSEHGSRYQTAPEAHWQAYACLLLKCCYPQTITLITQALLRRSVCAFFPSQSEVSKFLSSPVDYVDGFTEHIASARKRRHSEEDEELSDDCLSYVTKVFVHRMQVAAQADPELLRELVFALVPECYSRVCEIPPVWRILPDVSAKMRRHVVSYPCFDGSSYELASVRGGDLHGEPVSLWKQ